MSWDAALYDDRGHVEGAWNYTHNTSCMFYDVLNVDFVLKGSVRVNGSK
jgi:hypothetical protein